MRAATHPVRVLASDLENKFTVWAVIPGVGEKDITHLVDAVSITSKKGELNKTTLSVHKDNLDEFCEIMEVTDGQEDE